MGVRAVPYWLKVDPFTEINALGRYTRAAERFAARGESEPFAVATRVTDKGSNIRFSTEAWRRDGQTVAPLDVSIRLMMPFRVRATAGRKPTQMVLEPFVLLAAPDNRWYFPAHYTLTTVVDVHVSLQTEPGLYEFSLRVSSEAGEVEKIPLSLEVLPFTLKVNDFHAGAYGTSFVRRTGGLSGYHPEMIEMDSRFGFNLAGAFFNKGYEIPFRPGADGLLEVDTGSPKFENLNKQMLALRKFGMGDVMFWNWGGSHRPESFNAVLRAAGASGGIETAHGKETFAQVLYAIKQTEKKFGWPEVIVNPYDEALMSQDTVREIIASLPRVRSLSPDTRLYMTEWRTGYTRHYQSSGKQLSGDKRPREKEWQILQQSGEQPIFNFAVIGSNRLDDAARALQDHFGGEYWHYATANYLSAATRFAYGFRPWIQRSEAMLIWANYWGDITRFGWSLHYPLPLEKVSVKDRVGEVPVIPGARAFAVREGIDDRKYIETLRFHAWEQKSVEDLEYLAELQIVSRSLLQNKSSIGGVSNKTGGFTKPFALQEMRSEIKERLVRLLDSH